jgi:hypothetical protein
MITLAEILHDGYGIDPATIRFEFRQDLDQHPTKLQVLNALNTAVVSADGQFIDDFDVVNGFVKLYTEIF